jgi:hypothetical protein
VTKDEVFDLTEGAATAGHRERIEPGEPCATADAECSRGERKRRGGNNDGGANAKRTAGEDGVVHDQRDTEAHEHEWRNDDCATDDQSYERLEAGPDGTDRDAQVRGHGEERPEPEQAEPDDFARLHPLRAGAPFAALFGAGSAAANC